MTKHRHSDSRNNILDLENPRCLFVCISNTSLSLSCKLVKRLIASSRGRERGVGRLKWIILQEGKKIGEAEQQSMVFPPGAPQGFSLSDLKWHPAVQTWVLWLHIKPFNHRAPCSTKKPLMRSLPRMNKQALMKRGRALSLWEGYRKQGGSWNPATVTDYSLTCVLFFFYWPEKLESRLFGFLKLMSSWEIFELDFGSFFPPL